MEKKLGDAELKVMQVLWRTGGCPARGGCHCCDPYNGAKFVGLCTLWGYDRRIRRNFCHPGKFSDYAESFG